MKNLLLIPMVTAIAFGLATRGLATPDELRADGAALLAAFSNELGKLTTELRTSQEQLLAFQKTHNVVFLQEEANGAGKYLVQLKQKLADVATRADVTTLSEKKEEMKKEAESIRRDIAKQEERCLELAKKIAQFQMLNDRVVTAKGLYDRLINKGLAALREVRVEKVPTKAALSSELGKLTTELRTSQEQLLAFQKTHNVVFLQEEANGAGKYLVQLKQKLADVATRADVTTLSEKKEEMKKEAESIRRDIAKQEERCLEQAKKIAQFQMLNDRAVTTKGLHERLLHSLREIGENVDP